MNRSKKISSPLVTKKAATPAPKKAVVVKKSTPTKPVVKQPAIKKPAPKKEAGVQAAKKVTLSLSVPETAAVFVAGDFNDWKPTELKLKKKGKGVFAIQISLKPGRYEYKFLVDGQWQHDPACPESVANAFGSFNSLLVVE